jgi:hypothetical protein
VSPNTSASGHDTPDPFGKLTQRQGSSLHPLASDAATTGTPALVLVTPTASVISKTDSHLIAGHHIDPDRGYWPD